jgi:hypothetical protein
MCIKGCSNRSSATHRKEEGYLARYSPHQNRCFDTCLIAWPETVGNGTHFSDKSGKLDYFLFARDPDTIAKVPRWITFMLSGIGFRADSLADG